uniref:Protein kinase domain-containing protein n=1 Tax=Caenorhabditis japonica TaxID=281687 RepID=A0A8R1ILH3_CAEJA
MILCKHRDDKMNWPGVCDLPHYKAIFPQWTFDVKKLEEASNLSGHGLDILREIVRYPPERRLTAKGALSHRYFLHNGFTQNRPTVTELMKEIREKSRTTPSPDQPIF